ncbi:unnamed protein product [Paramecium sonneborni]|uniref:Ankyrin repeat protein n=1 Tax=Paramecium sonneborni TaxID=65129 RepID=A0A8S1JWR7_9CILI|nr:unnamed protein product [Paramecium sonneborni]
MKGADPFIISTSGYNVFYICAYRGHNECLHMKYQMLRLCMFKNKKIKVQIRKIQINLRKELILIVKMIYYVLLCIQQQKGFLDVVRVLFENGANIYSLDNRD